MYRMQTLHIQSNKHEGIYINSSKTNEQAHNIQLLIILFLSHQVLSAETSEDTITNIWNGCKNNRRIIFDQIYM